MLIGWEPPKIEIESGRVVKLEVQWTTEEEKQANVNSKALYAIFFGVDLQKFKRIATDVENVTTNLSQTSNLTINPNDVSPMSLSPNPSLDRD